MSSTDNKVIDYAPGLRVRGCKPPLRLGGFKLAAFDMDSTLINIECIDEVAAAAGKKAEVAAITEAAMRGEITDFKESLRRRLALLKGVPLGALQQVLDERLRFNPGVPEFCAALHAAGVHLLLVSGGFTFFARPVAQRLGMDALRSNELEVIDGRLTGQLVTQPWGEIVDGEEKRRTLLSTCVSLGIQPQQAMAVGDGANDLPMMSAAGLSIAFHAKPKVREQAMISLEEGGMDRLLEILR